MTRRATVVEEGSPGARLMRVDLQVLVALTTGLVSRLLPAGRRPLGPLMLELRGVLSLPFPVGDTDRLELKLDTEEEEEDVFLLWSVTLLV